MDRLWEIKCACKDPKCKIAIWTEKVHDECALWFRDREGRENVMYLDIPSLLELIRALRNCLDEIIDEKIGCSRR